MIALKMFFFEEKDTGLELFNGLLKDYPYVFLIQIIIISYHLLTFVIIFSDSVMVKFLGGWVARISGDLERYKKS